HLALAPLSGDSRATFLTARVQHGGAGAVDIPGDRGRQPGLADAARTGDEHDPAGAFGRLSPPLAQDCEIPFTSEHGRRVCEIELARQRPRLKLERRVLAEDRLVEAPQLSARLDADPLDEQISRLAVGVKRLRLPTAPVQREHALGVWTLAQRVLRDERLDLADDNAVTTGG